MPSKNVKRITAMLKQEHKSFITEGKNNTTQAQVFLGIWVNSDQKNQDSANGQQLKEKLLELLMPLSQEQKLEIAKSIPDPHKSLTEIITKIEVREAKGEEKADLVKSAWETPIASGGASRDVDVSSLDEDIRKAMTDEPKSLYSQCLDSNKSLQDFIRHLDSKNLNNLSKEDFVTQYKSWQEDNKDQAQDKAQETQVKESQSMVQTVLSSLTNSDGKYIVEGGNVYENLNQMLLSSLPVLLHPKCKDLTSAEKFQLRTDFVKMGIELTAKKMPPLTKAPSLGEQHDARRELFAAGILVEKNDKISFARNNFHGADGKLLEDVTKRLNRELKGMQGTAQGTQKANPLIDGLRDKGASNIAAVPANGAAAIAEKGLNVSGKNESKTDENKFDNTPRYSGPQA